MFTHLGILEQLKAVFGSILANEWNRKQIQHIHLNVEINFKIKNKYATIHRHREAK